MPHVPLVQRAEEGLLRQPSADGVEIAPDRGALAVDLLPEVGQPWNQRVAADPLELLVERGRPGRHRRELVLERADDDRSEPPSEARRHAPVDLVEQAGARVGREVVESSLDRVEEHQAPPPAPSHATARDGHLREHRAVERRGGHRGPGRGALDLPVAVHVEPRALDRHTR